MALLGVLLGVAGVAVVLIVWGILSFMWGIMRIRPGAPKNPLAEFVPSLREDQEDVTDQLGPRIRNLGKRP